jgi:class 3 adenylate cyclase
VTLEEPPGQDRRMLLRIGINLGDALIEGDDILGDGINVATRLEGIVAPGGISSSVYDQVRGKVAVEFADLGEQSLKNIARSVQVGAVMRSTKLKAFRSIPSASIDAHATSRPMLCTARHQNALTSPLRLSA